MSANGLTLAHEDDGTGDDWMTPPPVIELARQYLGCIDLDPASHAAAQKYVQADTYYTKETNGLDASWHGNVWCNPPYSKGLIDGFTQKAIEEWKAGESVENMLLLVNAQCDTKWFQSLLNSASAVCFWKGRMKFYKIIDGVAYGKWKSSKTGKMTNSPRYINTVFCFSRKNTARFHSLYFPYGKVLDLC